VTAGIVSAKGRAMGLATFENFIQTDAAINPGNSGGPLINLEGKVIGINTAISTRTGGSMGLGFAIPSEIAQNVVDNIIDKGKVSRGYLGASIQPLTEELAKSFGYESSSGGVLLGDVIAGGPAAKAGLKAGDIVVAINNKSVHNPNELLNTIAASAPNSTISVEAARDGKHHTFDVTLAERPGQRDLASSAGSGSDDDSDSRATPRLSDLGLSAQNLTPSIARQLNITGVDEGVVVTQVQPGSTAAKAGLHLGDVILEVAGNAVSNVDDFNDTIAKADLSSGVRLHVRTQGVSHFVMLKNEAKNQ